MIRRIKEWLNHKLILFCLKRLRIYCKYCDKMVKVDWYEKTYDYQILCINDENLDNDGNIVGISHGGTMLGRYRNFLYRDQPYWVDIDD